MSIPDDPFSTRPALHLRTAEHLEPLHDPEAATGDGAASAPAAQGQGGSGTSHTPVLLLPGQSAGGAGTKTPRRVQWENASHVVQLEPEPSSPQTLDRHSLDVIDAALERHRTNPLQRPRSHLSHVSSEPGSQGEDYDYRLDVDPPRAHPPPTQPLEQVGSTESQRTRQGDESSFAALLDNGINDHIEGERIPLGETDGLPNITRTEDQSDMDAATNLVRAHTGKWGILRRRVKGAGAVNRAFGTPGGMRPVHEDEGRRTEGDAEKGEGGVTMGVQRQNTTTARQDAFAARYPEPAPSYGGGGGMGSMPQIPGGASVLSSLLALYNQQNMPQSGTTSAASSRPSSIYESSDDEDEKERQKAKARDRETQRRSSEVHKGLSGWLHRDKDAGVVPREDETPPEVVIHSENRRPSEVAMDLDPPHALGHQRSQSTSSLTGDSKPSASFLSALRRAKKYTDKATSKLNKELEEHDRPKAARSGAGVFGALIQNTQNISGVATPTAATLAPAAARPGYQLNRYTLPTEDATALLNPWRPAGHHSHSQSRPTSRPVSVHSSTAVDDSPTFNKEDMQLKKNTSSDDMLSIKSKSKSFTPGGRNRSHLNLETLGKLPGQALKTGGHAVKNAEKWVLSGGKTPLITPPLGEKGEYFTKPLTEDEKRRKEWEAEKKRRRKQKEARKKQEIFIIQHVAAILQRQQFILKLARALMMFGSPSHRLETQIQATAKVLEINAQVVYLPGTMLISFGDDATHTSETKFLKQATGLDLGKLLATHKLYWNVVHDKMSVDQASKDLDVLMTTPVYYSWWQSLIIGGLASAFITVVGFYGSFIDALAAAFLGALLCAVQILAARNDMFSNVFEIVIATIISFIAAALASTRYFCYTALVSGGVVLILPGYIVLCGALELAARNITAGAVRIGYSVIYSLFLGFGISIGAELYQQITGLSVSGAADFQCTDPHSSGLWYQVTPSQWWYFLCCPGFAFALSLRNQQPLWAKELPIMVLIACAGWASNHFSALGFPNRSDMTSAIGSFVVGTLGNLYGKLSKGSSFPVTVVGILFQLPSGLSNGGIFNTTSGSTQAYSSGFQVAQQLVSVAIGLTVGLFVSAAVTHPFGGGRRRGSGIFSF